MPGKGRPYKKGHNKPGPGRPPAPPEVKKAANLSMTEARAKLSEYLALSLPELELVLKDRTKPAMDLWVARIVLIGIKNGDQVRLNFMFDRLIGRVKEQVEHTGVRPLIIEYSDGKQVYLGAEQTKES